MGEALLFAPTITLTREELYEKVWSTPMQKLAAEFGLSDVGLAKRCRRHRIPVPTRGHWARLRAGQDVEQPPLPPVIQGWLATIKIYAHERQSREPRAEIEKQDVPTIIVAQDGPLSHCLAIRIEKNISRS